MRVVCVRLLFENVNNDDNHIRRCLSSVLDSAFFYLVHSKVFSSTTAVSRAYLMMFECNT